MGARESFFAHFAELLKFVEANQRLPAYAPESSESEKRLRNWCQRMNLLYRRRTRDGKSLMKDSLVALEWRNFLVQHTKDFPEPFWLTPLSLQ
jgi:hypothetical protein